MKAITETRLAVILVILVSVCSGLTVAVSAIAADFYVPAGYPTIQAAVDAAHSNDTIHMLPACMPARS